MLARVAASFYWLGRYLERTRHTIRLVRYPLDRLVDRPGNEIAIAWEVVHRTLGQALPESPEDGDEADAYLLMDAYTLAGSLIEEASNPDSILSCWSVARENARQVRSHLPLAVWTCLNQGYLWIREIDLPSVWTAGPSAFVGEASDRLRLLAGMMDAIMYRDDGWRFMVLGRFVERVQHQAAFLSAWLDLGQRARGSATLPWADLLRICGAYEVFGRRYSMEVRQEQVLAFLVQDPELPRSLRFAVQHIEEMLAGIDPAGARYPLAPAHRTALRLASALEVETLDGERGGSPLRFFHTVGSECRRLHDVTVASYLDHTRVGGTET